MFIYNWIMKIVKKIYVRDLTNKFIKSQSLEYVSRGDIKKVLEKIKEGLDIEPCDGLKTIANAQDIFSYIDQKFKSWDLDKPSENTAETKADVYELVGSAHFQRMIEELNLDPNDIYFSQDQILYFIQNHREYLSHSWYTFFLLKRDDDEFFVACVLLDNGKLKVGVDRFDYEGVFDANAHPRIVVKQP